MLADPESERALMFQRARSGAVYVERDDQSFGTRDGVKGAVLTRDALAVVLNVVGQKALGCSSLTVRLDLDDGAFDELREALTAILEDALTITKAAKTNAKAAKAKKPKAGKDWSKVRALDLGGKGLETLPSYVAEMSALEELSLHDNPALDLDAAFAVLAKLPTVRVLRIEPVRRSGAACALPPSVGRLIKLRNLSVTSEDAVVLPKQIGALRALEELTISAPKWSAPYELFALPRLKSLALGGCDVVCVPESVTKLAHLERVYLAGATKLDVPDALRKLGKLPGLRYLQLSSASVPPEIGACRSLQELRIVRYGREPLRLPEELWSLPALKKLDLGGNVLRALPAGVGRLASLEALSLYECGVTKLPDSLGDLPRLAVLNVASNPRLKTLPRSLSKRSKLEIHR